MQGTISRVGTPGEQLAANDSRKYADTPIMPSKVLHNGPLTRKIAYIEQCNKAYSA